MSAMKEIRTVDAVGQVLCHDITQIVRGVTKNARFRKGHVIQEEDVPVLLSLGKDHIYVWDEDATEMHENEAADVLRELCQNEHMTATAPKEGQIELIADCDGVFQVDEDRFDAVNELEDVTIATLAQNMPVKKGMKLAGMRVTPLFIAREKMEEVRRTAGTEPLLRLLPYRKDLKVGVVTTGTEVFLGRIEDTFTPVIAAKLKKFGLTIAEHRLSDDVTEHTKAAIEELLDLGMDIILCTGGTSGDAGVDIVTYGAPVLPGAMFLLGYSVREGREVTVMGLPGCVMFDKATVFDMILPRAIAGDRVTRKEIRHFGIGGLCMRCEVCRYPICPFQK